MLLSINSGIIGSRFTFAFVQAFRVGEGFYLHGQVEDIQSNLWEDWPLPLRP